LNPSQFSFDSIHRLSRSKPGSFNLQVPNPFRDSLSRVRCWLILSLLLHQNRSLLQQPYPTQFSIACLFPKFLLLIFELVASVGSLLLCSMFLSLSSGSERHGLGFILGCKDARFRLDLEPCFVSIFAQETFPRSHVHYG
jgi:hypothetical protein